MLTLEKVCLDVKDKVDISENKNKNQQVSKLSINTDVSGVLPFFSVKNNRSLMCLTKSHTQKLVHNTVKLCLIITATLFWPEKKAQSVIFILTDTPHPPPPPPQISVAC